MNDESSRDVIFYLGNVGDPIKVDFDFEYIYNKAKELGFKDDQEFERRPIMVNMYGNVGIKNKLFNFYESKGMELSYKIINLPEYNTGDIVLVKFLVKTVHIIDGKIKYRTDLLGENADVDLCKKGAFDQIFTGGEEESIDARYVITKIGKIGDMR